jgi:hypothetical protein
MQDADDDLPIDGPTFERLTKAKGQHEDFVTDTGRRTKRLLDGDILEVLNLRGSLTGDQYVAGKTFYRDWYEAGMAASGVIDPARVVVDGGTHKPAGDRQLDALWRWKRAVQSIGIVHSKPVICMLLCDEPLLDYGRRVFKRQQEKQATVAAITALQLGLQALDYHYHGQRRTGARTFHSPDFEVGIPPIDTQDPVS